MKDYIHLKAINIPTFLGLAEGERKNFQFVDADFYMYFSAKKPAESGELRDCVDYVRVLGEVRFIMWFARFYLIETALETLAEYVLKSTVASKIKIKMSKPQALNDGSVPSLVISRKLEDYSAVKQFGEISIENRDVIINRTNDFSTVDLNSNTTLVRLAISEDDRNSDWKRGTLRVSTADDKRSVNPIRNVLSVSTKDSLYNIEQNLFYPLKNSKKLADVKLFNFYESVLDTYITRN